MANCRGCGKEIVWGVLPGGKKIPLDPKPPTYFYSMMDEGATIAPVGTYVRHYCLMPDSD